MVAWGPILGAGISVLGKLFGGGKKTTTNEVDYVKLRDSAEKAGFNPLTALRNGGAAGFSVTTHPALSFGERLGEAASTFGGFLMDYDANADKRAEQESRLLEAQLGLIQAETDKAKSWSFNVPSAQGSSRKSQDEPELGSRSNPIQSHVWYQGRDGSMYQGVNPDIPDADQVLTPGMMRVEDDMYRGRKAVFGDFGEDIQMPALSLPPFVTDNAGKSSRYPARSR